MASDLMESYIQQFSHNTAEIVSTTTKIPTVYGSKAISAVTTRSFCKNELSCSLLLRFRSINTDRR